MEKEKTKAASKATIPLRKFSRVQAMPQMTSTVRNGAREKAKAIISKILKEELKRRDMSQLDFALRLNRNPSLISHWLNGKHNFTLDSLSDAFEVLGFSLSDFFQIKEDEESEEKKSVIPIRKNRHAVASRAGSRFYKKTRYRNLNRVATNVHRRELAGKNARISESTEIIIRKTKSS